MPVPTNEPTEGDMFAIVVFALIAGIVVGSIRLFLAI